MKGKSKIQIVLLVSFILLFPILLAPQNETPQPLNEETQNELPPPLDAGAGVELNPPEVHVTMRHYRYGVLIDYSHHAGVVTTAGLNWIAGQLGGTPSTDPAKWIGLSNDPSAPNAGWTEIPGEITTGGMGRALGVYTPTGDGVWEIEFVYSPTETASCQLTGLYYTSSGVGLLASDLINLINYQADTDTVTITWEITQT